MPFILALDQGTASSRAIVFDRDGAIRAIAQKEFTQMFPSPGWVEHDPQEIWASQIGVAVEALGRAHARPKDIAAIGMHVQEHLRYRLLPAAEHRHDADPIDATAGDDGRVADRQADGVRARRQRLHRRRRGAMDPRRPRPDPHRAGAIEGLGAPRGPLGRAEAMRVKMRRGRARGSPPLTAFRKSGTAEISGLGSGGMAVHVFGNAGENQHRSELRGHDIGLADAEVVELKFVEFTWSRQPSYTNAQGELWRMVTGHLSCRKGYSC